MLVPNGKTVFLGGLIKHSINNTKEGIPGLGDLPIIGGLFSNNSKNISSSEIVVLITPRIVDYSTNEAEDSSLERVKFFNEIINAELQTTEKEMNNILDRRENNSGPYRPDK